MKEKRKNKQKYEKFRNKKSVGRKEVNTKKMQINKQQKQILKNKKMVTRKEGHEKEENETKTWVTWSKEKSIKSR